MTTQSARERFREVWLRDGDRMDAEPILDAIEAEAVAAYRAELRTKLGELPCYESRPHKIRTGEWAGGWEVDLRWNVHEVEAILAHPDSTGAR